MKSSTRLIAVVLTLVTLVSIASINVSAANTVPEPLNGYDIWVDGRELTPREKDDATAHYYYITSSNYSVMRVSSHGLTNFFDGNYDQQNTTRSNGQYVSYVVCRVGTKYSIVNRVYEDGYSWATLCVSDYYSPSGGYLYGEWSPDSTTAYTVLAVNPELSVQ